MHLIESSKQNKGRGKVYAGVAGRLCVQIEPTVVIETNAAISLTKQYFPDEKN